MDARLSLFARAQCPRLVVKIGSALLVEKNGQLRRDWLASVLDDIAALHKAGQQIVIVSSGAIALGAKRMDLPKGGRASLEDAQASAAVGQIYLSQVYAELLAERGLGAAQLLLTLDDLEHRRRYLNVAATLERLLSLGMVPVLNENDTVATSEIRFGDNDRLAARIAQAAGAQAVVLLSDVDGLYTANPSVDKHAKMIPTVEDVDAVMQLADHRSGSGLGSGGMIAKLQAAKIAASAGINLAIAQGHKLHALQQFLETGHGTVFIAPPSFTARKAWLAGRLTVKGKISIDAGAVTALQQGKSLLAAGVRAVEGHFQRGDPVDIMADGKRVARGLAAYDAQDAIRIAGKRSDELEEILGYAPRSAFIHRDHLVML